MNPGFWTVFKADLLFGVCSITLSVVLTVAIAWWRRKKASTSPGTKVLSPVMPHVVVIGGKEASPSHCPLCGNGWPLPGPVLQDGPRMDLSFKCPDCGGSSFGSAATTPDPAGPLHRYCHGDDAGDGKHGCKFNFPEKDDWKHFTCNGKKLGSPEEYQVALEKARPGAIAGFGSHGPIDMGLPPKEVALCEPVPVSASGVMTCRRGQGQRTFQGQKPPTCDGFLAQSKVVGQPVSFMNCLKCGLAHATGEKDGVRIYGALL